MGLTQALSDGTNTYIYGNDRIAQMQGSTTNYFLGDALGSVRQLTNANGNVSLTKSYAAYGNLSQSVGSSQTIYGFTNEYASQGLIYLRSRYYSPESGRFLTKDSWMGDYDRPLSLHRWMYVEGNPVNYTDPSGHFPFFGEYIYWPFIPTNNLTSSNSANALYECNTIISKPPCYEWKWIEKEIDIFTFPFGLSQEKIIVPQLVPCGSTQTLSTVLISSNLSQLPAQNVCESLESQYYAVLGIILTIDSRLDRLLKELDKNPESKEKIINKILELEKERDKQKKKLQGIKDAANIIGCNVSSWFIPD